MQCYNVKTQCKCKVVAGASDEIWVDGRLGIVKSNVGEAPRRSREKHMKDVWNISGGV